MSDLTAFYPDRFKRAARYYAAGRPDYPVLLSKRVADAVGFLHEANVLDIGTGPGFLAIDFAQHARAVTALEPSAEMLDVAAENAARAGVAITFVKGSSHDLNPSFGHFKLVTFGRSFHWTDRVETLTVLDQMIEVGGAVALFRDSFPEVRQNPWYSAYQAVLERHGSKDPARSARRLAPSHEEILLDSAFDHLERIAVLERRFTPIARFVDRALSYGKAWHDDASADLLLLADQIHAALAPYVRSDGSIEEIVEGHALIARRSADVALT